MNEEIYDPDCGACERAQQDYAELERVTDDLAALVRQLVRSLRKTAPDNDLADKALDYLKRKGLQGSPLRHNNDLRELVNEPDFFATPEELDRARAVHGSDEIEIDEGAFTSRCEEENGLWVSAWVWVKMPEPEYGKGVLNEYTCPACGTEWESEWDCACNDDCPACGCREVMPDGDGS